jgi:hypothetical protein
MQIGISNSLGAIPQQPAKQPANQPPFKFCSKGRGHYAKQRQIEFEDEQGVKCLKKSRSMPPLACKCGESQMTQKSILRKEQENPHIKKHSIKTGTKSIHFTQRFKMHSKQRQRQQLQQKRQ